MVLDLALDLIGVRHVQPAHARALQERLELGERRLGVFRDERAAEDNGGRAAAALQALLHRFAPQVEPALRRHHVRVACMLATRR